VRIRVSKAILQQREMRWEEARRFKVADRMPVLAGIGTRYWLPLLDISFKDYFGSPGKMLAAQLEGSRLVFESMRDDRYGLTYSPDFQNVREASGLGCEVAVEEYGTPWVRGPVVNSPSDLQAIRRSEMYEVGFTAKMISYYRGMLEAAKSVTIEGDDFSARPEVTLGLGTDGPFTNLGWIRGATRLMLDVRRNREFVHEMMEVVTEKIINFNDYVRELTGRPRGCEIGLADDLAAYLSPEDYRELVLPYHEEMYNAFGTRRRSMHLCGKTDHLLRLLLEEERVRELSGFGWVVNPGGLAEVMGGKAFLYGGVSPMLIHEGPPSRIVEESRRYIEVFKPCGGYALGDGYNIAPGTPPEHINAMVDAAEAYGAASP